MCEFKSGIIFKNRVELAPLENESHSSLLEKLDIEDNEFNASKKFVRAELIPPEKYVITSDISKWTYKVDQDIVPEWYSNDPERYEDEFRESVKDFMNKHFKEEFGYYWTNITIDAIPENNSLVLSDIMENNVDEKYFYKKDFRILNMDKKVCAELKVNTMDMLRRIYNPNFKCATLTCISGGYQEKKVLDHDRPRKLTELEYERLQGLPDNYTNVEVDGRKISYTKRCSMCGNAWTLPVIKHIFKGLIME